MSSKKYEYAHIVGEAASESINDGIKNLKPEIRNLHNEADNMKGIVDDVLDVIDENERKSYVSGEEYDLQLADWTQRDKNNFCGLLENFSTSNKSQKQYREKLKDIMNVEGDIIPKVSCEWFESPIGRPENETHKDIFILVTWYACLGGAKCDSYKSLDKEYTKILNYLIISENEKKQLFKQACDTFEGHDIFKILKKIGRRIEESNRESSINGAEDAIDVLEEAINGVDNSRHTTKDISDEKTKRKFLKFSKEAINSGVTVGIISGISGGVAGGAIVAGIFSAKATTATGLAVAYAHSATAGLGFIVGSGGAALSAATVASGAFAGIVLVTGGLVVLTKKKKEKEKWIEAKRKLNVLSKKIPQVDEEITKLVADQGDSVNNNARYQYLIGVRTIYSGLSQCKQINKLD